MSNRIPDITAESIQDINDVKKWARDHEIRMDNRTKNIQEDIKELRVRDDELQESASRSIRLLMIACIFFAVSLAIIVVLSTINQISSVVNGVF